MSSLSTSACQDRDFPEWHGGRSHALVWALMLDASDIEQCLTAARGRLAGLLLPRYRRQPHVTVAFAGLAAEPGLPGYDDDRLSADLATMQSLIEGPVEIRPTGWGSFAMVPYLGVEANWLHAARAALDITAVQLHKMPYVPHVTVGHWCGEWPFDVVLERLEGPVPQRSWSVSKLSLLRYATRDIAGPLEEVGSLDLVHGLWSPVGGALFRDAPQGRGEPRG
ncbi:MAG: 2'-5' RNA ligase family protein [Arachnia sp.]